MTFLFALAWFVLIVSIIAIVMHIMRLRDINQIMTGDTRMKTALVMSHAEHKTAQRMLKWIAAAFVAALWLIFGG